MVQCCTGLAIPWYFHLYTPLYHIIYHGICKELPRNHDIFLRQTHNGEIAYLHKHFGARITLGRCTVHRHRFPVTGELQSEVLLH